MNIFRILALATILTSLCQPVLAARERTPGLGLSIGGGPAVVQFDSNFKVTNRSSGQSLFVDTEGTLNLPSVAHSPILNGMYRFNRTHGITFSYFDIRRSSQLLDAELDLGDYTAYGDIVIRDTSSFYSLGYSYALHEDDRSFVLASLGIFGLDLGLALEASGGIRSPTDLLNEARYEDTLGVFAPLPLFGLDFWWSYTERWGMGTKVALITGSYADVSAFVLDTTIRAVYKLSSRFDAMVGMKYFSADVDVKDEQYLGSISYGINGMFFGINYNL